MGGCLSMTAQTGPASGRGASSNVLAARADAGEAVPENPAAEIDWAAVRADVAAAMKSDSHDDGSYAPVLIRLGWHSAGTYDAKADNKGGVSNAGMRFAPEQDDPENAGLAVARNILAPVKAKHPNVSYSDLWIVAAYEALKQTGGPELEFSPGRKDGTAETSVEPGRLPEAEHGLGDGVDEEGRINGWENLAKHIREVFNRMDFNDQEIVALISGGHVYGRCHREHSGYAGAWVENPIEFSNEFAADLIEDEWMMVEHDTKVNGVLIPEETRPAPGKRQYMSKWEPSEEEIANGKPNPPVMEGKLQKVSYQMMLPSDMVMLWDPDFRKHLEVYAEDEDQLKEDFGKAYKRLTENGHTGCPFAKRS
mmetsp:Transcript_949/g.2769  ORF Transcript_949/g.2769 Transcript_949/m.2769 type:complete len:366 (+) Transcript_949:100-1197(+)